MLGQTDAQASCKRMGGHLVAWFSREEQVDVEGFFVSNGYLLPKFHKLYWMGFNALDWGAWGWIDPTAGSFKSAAYKHWGLDEPNNEPPMQLCGAANSSQAYSVLSKRETRGQPGMSSPACDLIA